ncbi:Vancomycin resistance protein YoaR, contains peptidoglycan-binding and VanW domains [Prauserella aidingensis]|uniref:VanW family protein n=1 Tax=Prauserella aidingensis TaxID=387890 RepID=UPI0020A24DF8|nr:VanW family protein [Prauserella aidingensis]MCP2255933.1 Vancomycin resistance protein YoaR, contains peptidoglycan-binding and VanW domains [Prauserella aidingensis]
MREEYDRPWEHPAHPGGDAARAPRDRGEPGYGGYEVYEDDGSLNLPDNWLLSHDPAWPSDHTDPEATGTDLPAAAFSAYPSVRYRDEAAAGSGEVGLAADLLGPAEHRKRPARTKLQRGIGKAFMIFGGTVVVLLFVYLVDLVTSLGDVPRGVTVAGVEVGGLSRAEAEEKLRTELGPQLTDPLPVHAGDVTTRLDPADAGLGLDWAGTVERAGNQPIDPLSRLTSLFTTHEIGVVSSADDDKLREAITGLARNEIDHEVREGDVGFRTVSDDGAVEPFPIMPRQGQRLTDVDSAMKQVKADWLADKGVTLDVDVTPAKTTDEAVRQALAQTKPLVSAPVTVRAEDATATLTPKHISAAMKHSPAEGGALQLTLDRAELQDLLAPRLSDTERSASNAELVFAGSRPSVEPSEEGRRIDWQETFAPFVTVAGKQDGRTLDVVYQTQAPDVSTQDLRQLGVKEVVGEFTTGGLSGAAAENVSAMAEAVTGSVVRPGETFSLEEATGPRTSSKGYVEAPLYADGTGPRVIGGGASQLTSTLYNAAYEAGLKDAGHTAHPTYVDRYPAGRDAVSQLPDGSTVDMSLTNNLDSGVAVQAWTSGDSVTVRLWGTKQYRVSGSTSDRTDVKSPPVQRERGPGCEESAGAEGFTVTDTRVVKALRGDRVVDRQSTTVTYRPVPRVICEHGDGGNGGDDDGGGGDPRRPGWPFLPGDGRGQQVDRSRG